MIDFNFLEDFLFEDERVLLRPLEKSDIEHLLPFALNEPDIWKYSLVQPNSKENLISYIDQTIKARKEEKEYPFIVFDKRTNEYAGSTRFYDIQLTNSTLQLGYTWYGKNFQRTGLNRHCKFLLLQFAFDTMGFERVEFRADNSNERSINAMKAIGCTVESILRNNGVRADGTRRDSIILSILKNEWNEKIRTTYRIN